MKQKYLQRAPPTLRLITVKHHNSLFLSRRRKKIYFHTQNTRRIRTSAVFSFRRKCLCCLICTDVFRDPVVLSCSHSFCKTCLRKWWQAKKGRKCPCCKKTSSKGEPPCNLTLKNLCDAFLSRGEQGDPGVLCRLHSKKVRLFCLDHRQPACLVCRESETHNRHLFRPMEEAAQGHSEKLQVELRPLQEKRTLFEQYREKHEQTVKHMLCQARQTEGLVKEQFQNLHQFLREEEEARIAALKAEQEQKEQLMKEEIRVLSGDISALSDVIRATEKVLGAEDVSFLNNFKATEEKVQQFRRLRDPKPIPGSLINVAKHVGNLSFNIWKKMNQLVSYAPVILDPNTADPELKLSAHLRTVRAVKPQELPGNPEKNKYSCSVLSSEGFSSGTHVWDVHVGNNKDWEVGVLGDDTHTDRRPQSGLWRILLSDGKFTPFSLWEGEKDLTVETRLQKVRVQLDFGRGTLSFWDSDADTHLHTFTHKFTDTVFPYIYTESPLPLEILPAKVSLTVGSE